MKTKDTTEKMASLGRMTRGMIHDINNSLASILGYSEFLVTDLKQGSEPHEFAHNIHRATLQIQDLIDQIRAFSLEKGEGRDLALDLTSEIKMIAQRFEDITEGRVTITVQSHIGEAILSIPPHQFRTLINNIIKNGIEASASEKTTLTIALDDANESPSHPLPTHALTHNCMTATPHPALLRITITDDGMGMDDIILGLATEPYFSTKSSESAHGMGLTIARGILDHLGGGLSLSSTPNKGTSVTIYLPVDSLTKQASTDNPHNRKKANILLVEDRTMVRDTIEKMLSRNGHNVTACSNGFDALDQLREHTDNFNVIVTDYTMPELDGPNFVTELRNDFPDIPVIIMSGDHQYLRDLNADLGNLKITVLPKPVESVRLCNLIESAL